MYKIAGYAIEYATLDAVDYQKIPSEIPWENPYIMNTVYDN